MFVILGLGNPGEKYIDTRHNIGFKVIEAFAEKNRIPVKKKGFFSLYGVGCAGGKEVFLAKPQTFMNLSGKTAISILSKYNLSPEDLIVIHDEIDLEFGRIKTKTGGGDAGHRGIKSIAESLKSKFFFRIRIGVGRSAHGEEVSRYVLNPFNKEEKVTLNEMIMSGVDEIEKAIATEKAKKNF